MAEDDFEIDYNKAMLPQVGKLKSRYRDWVNKPMTKQFRMFESDLVEFFGKTKWWVIPIVWIPIILFLTWTGTALLSMKGSLLFATGFVFWSLLEYLLHRYIFHLLVDDQSEFWIQTHFTLHGQHHKFPMDPGRLVFPPVAGLMMATPFYILFRLTMPLPIAHIFTAGALTGYVWYDLTHYYLHHGKPTSKYILNLKEHHRNHHFKDHTKGFGISSFVWDIPFGTIAKHN